MRLRPEGARGELFGRQRELERFSSALSAAADGRGATVAVIGDAGIGKTALLDVVALLAREAGFAVAGARLEAIEQGRPFGLVRQFLDSRLTGPDADAIDAQFAPAGGGADAGWIDTAESRFRVVDLFVAAVERAATVQPLLLVVDDAQWADDSSLVALDALRRQTTELPVVLVVGARPGNPPAELTELIAAIPAEGQLTLGALDDDDVAALARRALGWEPSAELAVQLARADGNPFFLHALIEAHQAGDTHSPVPRSVAAAVLNQLSRVDASVLRVLRLAAVIGRPVSVDLLASLDEQPLTSMSERIEAAVEARLLADVDGCVGFHHDLVREALLDQMSPAVCRALHLAVGRGLLARSWAATEVAEHFLAGAEEGDVEAATVLRTAAAELERVWATAAKPLLERAVEILPEDHRDYLSACAELAQASVFSADLDRGLRLSEELLARLLPDGIELGLRNARSHVFFLSGRSREAAVELEQMSSLVTGQPRESIVLADAAVSSMFAIDLDRARDLAERSLAAASRTTDQVGPVMAHCVQAWLACLSGDLDTGLALSEEAVRIADAGDQLEGHRRIPHLFHSQALLWADRVDEAQESLARGRLLSARLGMGWDEPMYHALAADERVRAGQWDDAMSEIEAGLARADDVGSYFADGWLHAHHARVALAHGDLDTAAAALDAGEARLRGGGGQGADLLWWNRALLTAARGDVGAGLQSLYELWMALGALGTRLRQAELAPDLVRLATRLAEPEMADEVIGSLAEGPFAATRLATTSRRWCEALTRDSATGLQAVATELEARHAPVDAVRCRRDLARCDAGQDPPDPLVPAVAGRPDGPTPDSPSDTGIGPWDRLTKSERRVVELVACGLTNSAIAEELSVSRRTVESHLYRAYPKLGVTSRVELALLAVDRHDLSNAPSV